MKTSVNKDQYDSVFGGVGNLGVLNAVSLSLQDSVRLRSAKFVREVIDLSNSSMTSGFLSLVYGDPSVLASVVDRQSFGHLAFWRSVSADQVPAFPKFRITRANAEAFKPSLSELVRFSTLLKKEMTRDYLTVLSEHSSDFGWFFRSKAKNTMDLKVAFENLLATKPHTLEDGYIARKIVDYVAI